jgi:hypothetical protein
LLLVALLDGADRLAAQETVEGRGITSVIKLEEVVYGHRPELNGKFKMRATELTFAPDAYLGVHQLGWRLFRAADHVSLPTMTATEVDL